MLGACVCFLSWFHAPGMSDFLPPFPIDILAITPASLRSVGGGGGGALQLPSPLRKLFAISLERLGLSEAQLRRGQRLSPGAGALHRLRGSHVKNALILAEDAWKPPEGFSTVPLWFKFL